jgi:hypothetical protein
VSDQCWRRIDTDTGPVLIIELDEPDTDLPKTAAPEPSPSATRSPSTRSPATEMESCARCRRAFRPAAAGRSTTGAAPGLAVLRRWPDGPICSGCFASAVETYGHCAACRVHRLLPGVGPAGQRWCTDCAGGLGNFTCDRCGREGWIERVGTCGSCVLTDRINELLDDGTGRVRPELQPLADRITAMSRPRSGILWLSRPAPQGILRALAAGQVPLTHDGLSTLTPRRSVIYIRDLMIAAGILPPVDRFLFLFEQWWPTWLAGLDDPDHRKVLRHFITWHVLRTMRDTIARRGELGHGPNQLARQQLRAAAAFLHGLASHDRTLLTCRQADIDRFLVHRAKAHDMRPFLRWAMNGGHMPKLTLPPGVQKEPMLISQKQRIELLRRVHRGDGMDLTDRIIALLVLLYAQPLIRVQRLTIDDITTDQDGQLLIRLGEPASPVPPPFDDLVRQYLGARTNQTTATNPDSRWLFPGRRAGHPLHPTSMRLRLANLGVPNMPGRSRAIRELLRQAPPSIIAGMLGYGASSAEDLARESGTTWMRYAAGPHSLGGS